jgi:molecular chaperone GrpE (heat shock protein)
MKAMRDDRGLALAKWPFLLADALLLVAAYLIYRTSTLPMGFWQAGLAVLCVAGGTCLSILPFAMEYWVAAKLAQGRNPSVGEDSVRRLEGLAVQLSLVTEQWRTLKEENGKVAAAGSITKPNSLQLNDRVETAQVLNPTADGERNTETEKSHRAESDCLQVLIQVLDHVYALHLGALHSGQASLVEQLSNFQDACRGAARRIDLVPFIAEPTEPFNAERHQPVDSSSPPPDHAVVAETIATGYMFQGRLLRPALVRLLKSPEVEAVKAAVST